MEFPQTITPLILTFNEQDNIARMLATLGGAERIVVIDSGSTDQTLSILSQHPHVEVIYRQFDSFADQCNFGLTKIQTPWVLSLDADYLLSDAFVAELSDIDFSDPIAGYSALFVYMVHGRPLRGTLYPPRTVLYRSSLAQYRNEGHGHRVDVRGPIKALRAPIYHDDRKPLSRWFASQQRYVKQEADFLLATGAPHKPQDRLRLWLWPAPLLVFPYTLLVKGCILDGWRGWFYALQRLVAECMLALELLDRRLSGGAQRQRQHSDQEH